MTTSLLKQVVFRSNDLFTIGFNFEVLLNIGAVITLVSCSVCDILLVSQSAELCAPIHTLAHRWILMTDAFSYSTFVGYDFFSPSFVVFGCAILSFDKVPQHIFDAECHWESLIHLK